MKLAQKVLMAVMVSALLGGCANLFKYRPYARNVKKVFDERKKTSTVFYRSGQLIFFTFAWIFVS